MTSIGNGLRRAIVYLGVVALALMSAFLPTVPAHAASSVQVYLGYADDLRANPANFPTPWAGAPGVVFQGCTGCTYDSGALRIVNDSPLPVTVDSVIVRFGTCAFDIWPHGTTVPAGGQLIDTQLNANFASGCTADGTFDTSDLGPNGENWGFCSQSGAVPEVDVSIDGSASVFADTGQILNTGGMDKAACGQNESTQWTLIGSQPCPGATLALAPPSQTGVLGSTATVQATFANSCGTGLQGAAISFQITSGPNAGTTGTATTDANGVATFSYSSSALGTDTISASTTNPAGTITSNSVTVDWQQRQASLSLTGAGSGDFNDPASVAAVLSDSAGPIAGQTVSFALNGAQTCSAVTNSSGTATCSLTPAEAAGAYPLTASFAGSAGDTAASASGTFTVNHEETSLAYTGSSQAANGQPYTLSGTLTEDGVTPISGRTVSFTLGSGTSAQSCSGTTNASGSAACTIASVNQPPSTTSVPATAVFAGDAYYLPASAATATVRFTYLTGRAYGIASSGLVGISPTPDTGSVSTASAGTVAPPCVATISGLISAHTLCASVVTALNPGTSTATASVQDATIGVLGLPVIKVGLVQSQSQTMCTGSTGAATVTSISVGGIPLNISLHPAPNTTISVLGVTIVLNEQTPVPGGLTVNAVHIKALGLLDVVLASSTSDIHNC